jgi:HK97 family phage portal protein
LSDKAQANLLKSWNELHKGLRGSHTMGVLEEGMEIATIPVNHRDLQFLELRKFQLEEIARIYRVPLHLIQSLDRATNNNIEHQAIDFVMHTIRPWCVRIERRLNKCLFGPREGQRYFAEFNLDSLLRGDAASRAAFYSGLRNIGAITANEIRAKENMNPHPNPAADELYVQGAMVPLGTTPQEVPVP